MKKNYFSLLCGVFFLALIFPSTLVFGERAQLRSMSIINNAEFSTVTFSLSNTPVVRSYVLNHPDRIAIDFLDTKLALDLQKTSLKGSFFKKIRYGYPDGKTLRLVFDLTKKINFKLSTSLNNVVFKTQRPKAKINSPHSELSIQKTIHVPNHEIVTIVIDPGHGGQDPGAVGKNGTMEKNVVLDIAKQLALLINQKPHMRAVLTRDSDVFIQLVDRLKLARKDKADLFVAIHADSYFNKQSSGVSVYALSRRGATSVAARWLSNRENHSELGGLNLKELDDQSLQLRSVLIDLAQTATIIDSLRLGKSLLQSLDDITQLHYPRVEQAPFLVLKSPDIPSILIETGFLSNPKEEEKLRDSRYQRKIALAIFKGIQLYLKKYGTSLI